MSEGREFEDGAFHWVRLPRATEWVVARFEESAQFGPWWLVTGTEKPFQTKELAEIGPAIEPPPAPANAA